MSGGSSGEEDDGSGDIVDGKFGCPVIMDNHNKLKAIFGIMPPLQDGFPVEGDFATCFVEKYLAPCVAKDGSGEDIVDEAGELMS